jgi:hypothetical protein
MKRIKLILVCGLVLALTGLTTLVVAGGGPREMHATVRSVVGNVTYQVDGVGPFLPLKVNMDLNQNTVLKSGPGASAYLQVNGFTSTVKLTDNTTMTLAKMMATGTGADADSTTNLKLDGGTILGKVKKLSANSDYSVTVPNGTAGIRGTDFQVTVTFTGGGNFTVQFTSVTGTLVCQVSLPTGQTGVDTRTLTTGQTWTVTGTTSTVGPTTTLVITPPAPTPAAVLASITAAFNTFPAPTPAPTPGPGTGTAPTTPTQPTQPNQNPSQTGGS